VIGKEKKFNPSTFIICKPKPLIQIILLHYPLK